MSDNSSFFLNLWFHGYSPLSPELIATRVFEGVSPDKIPGDFVLGWDTSEGGNCIQWIASSKVSAIPCYLCLDKKSGRMHWGSNPIDCLRKAGLVWEWNDSAVMSVALLGHTSQDQSLAAGVHRMRAGSVVALNDGSITERKVSTVPDDTTTKRVDIEKLSECLSQIVGEYVEGKNVSLSLSAGYDSRLLLALVLKHGCMPDIATMGSPKTTDLEIAKAIAKDFGVTHRSVSLDARDYLRYGKEIARLTGGSKTADHWHTYLFAKNAGFGDDSIHLAGSNGEFIRSYYFDKGLLSELTACFPRKLAAYFLGLKNHHRRRLLKEGIGGVLSDKELARKVLSQLIDSVSGMQAKGWLNALDHFYAYQRVRHFIGNGLALFRAINDTRSPFLDYRFMEMAEELPRHERLNSRTHRKLIASLVPRLGDYPVANDGIAMNQLDHVLYWRRHQPVTGYSVFSELANLDDFKELIMDSPHLDRFMPFESRLIALKDRRFAILGFLLSLHFASVVASEHNEAVASQILA